MVEYETGSWLKILFRVTSPFALLGTMGVYAPLGVAVIAYGLLESVKPSLVMSVTCSIWIPVLSLNPRAAYGEFTGSKKMWYSFWQI